MPISHHCEAPYAVSVSVSNCRSSTQKWNEKNELSDWCFHHYSRWNRITILRFSIDKCDQLKQIKYKNDDNALYVYVHSCMLTFIQTVIIKVVQRCLIIEVFFSNNSKHASNFRTSPHIPSKYCSVREISAYIFRMLGIFFW